MSDDTARCSHGWLLTQTCIHCRAYFRNEDAATLAEGRAQVRRERRKNMLGIARKIVRFAQGKEEYKQIRLLMLAIEWRRYAWEKPDDY